ncbi:2'-5' RNA ligase family protein [Dyella humicola]|uniref:2'-5' RNA ligase family protein n=1 Tax=Dyella humicola TaxID=2992126 RepID=UPI0022531023|nr:2'-5' RNA ligase family protein [Dyella humicola]
MGSRRSSPPESQPDLLGGGSTEAAAIHRLFFALLPGEAVSGRIERAARDVAATQHLRARLIRPSRYHATLHFLGDHPLLRSDIVTAAITAAGKVHSSPFELVLDHAAGFHGREPPCVLRCSNMPSALQTLWQDLRQSLMLAGLGAQLSRNFTPHVTFAYSRGALPQPAPIDPITWRVEGFALLHSVVGGGEYRTLDAWRFPAG